MPLVGNKMIFAKLFLVVAWLSSEVLGKDRIITPENFKDFFGPNGGTVSTEADKAPSYNDTIGMTSFLYPQPNGTVNMSFIDVQMNVQTNAHNTTLFQEKFNHSSICMSMDNSSFSCWPMFRISRFPRFAGVSPGNHTIIATLIDPMSGRFIKNSTSISKFKYKPVNWTQWAIEQEERRKWEEEFEEVEVEVEEMDDEDEKKDPWKSKHSWFDRHKKKKKKKKKIIRRRIRNGGNETLGLNETNGTSEMPVDDLKPEERGFKIATGNKFKNSNITVKSEEELFNTKEKHSDDDAKDTKNETVEEEEPIPVPLIAIDTPMENAWVNRTFEVDLQIITSANVTKFKKVFANAYMCLSLDDATHTCWPIFEENYLPKFSNVKPGKHTLKAAISHPLTGEIIEGTGIGIRTFNVRGKLYNKKTNTSTTSKKPARKPVKKKQKVAVEEELPAKGKKKREEKKTQKRSRTFASPAQHAEPVTTNSYNAEPSHCPCTSCGAASTSCSDPFFSRDRCSYSSVGNGTNYQDDALYEIYEEETVRVRKKIPRSKKRKSTSSLHFSPTDSFNNIENTTDDETQDYRLRGNGMSGTLDEVILYLKVNDQKVSLRVSKGEDYKRRAYDFCSEYEISNNNCVQQITEEINLQMGRSPHLHFSTRPLGY